jgi:ComF family protein
MISEKGCCLSCREKGAMENERYNERLVKLRSLFPFEMSFKTVLSSYKFGKSLGLGNFFARCLELALEEIPDRAKAAWVPVPPRPGKIKSQGWDQIDFLAKQLKKQQTLPLRRCLKRLASRSQKELNQKERVTNLDGRIQCIKKPPETAILFDDVITTGATMNACAAALLEGGAKKVYGICLFYK